MRHARATAAETGRAYLSPYNDPVVVAGQGTIGIEMLEATWNLAAEHAAKLGIEMPS